MSDLKTPGDKPLSMPTGKLSIKRPAEQGTVRQSFSHGRSKTVVVEKVKRRAGTDAPAPVQAPVVKRVAAPAVARSAQPAAPTAARSPAAAPSASAPQPAARAPAPRAPAPAGQKASIVLRTLTDEERNRQGTALAEELRREQEERKHAEEEARQRALRDEAERKDREAADERKRDEEGRRRSEDQAKKKAEEEARRRFGDTPMPSRPPGSPIPRLDPRPAPSAAASAIAATTTASASPSGTATRAPARSGASPSRPGLSGATPTRRTLTPENESGPRPAIRRPGGGMVARPAPAPRTPKGGEHKQRGRLTLSNALAGDDERMRSLAAQRRRQQRMKGGAGEQKEKIQREVIVPETISIQELANRMAERAVDVIRLLMAQGQMLKITDVVDADTAQLVAEEMGHTVKRVAESDVEEGLFDTPDLPEDLLSRPPVVTIMGHVDHGKTSLLDAIRSADVVSGEAGGITQHIGAYQVVSPLGGKITFIDTPGHAAFTAMRARGAKVTDIVILVVAADDGVMPQTVEAISHAKAAHVPIIVAINKIDKPDAKPERVRSELLQYEIQVESLGGDVLEVEVSATKKTNLDKLLEAVTLQSEVLDLKADPNRSGEGAVIEARLDRGRGPVATVLVQRGTLKAGDIVVAGSEWGRIRTLLDDKGLTLASAGPSTPVEVLGFNGTPDAGDRVAVVENEARAREVTAYRTRQKREKSVARQAGARGSLADMMQDLKTGAGRKEFPLVVKGDVQGSVEAITGALEKLGNEEVGARVILSGVGGITESDVILANASGAAVIGFNVRAHKEAREAAEQAGIEIRYYNIIYNLVDDVKDAMSGLLAPTLRETMLGNAQILEIFSVSKVGKIAGCRVTDGVVQKGANVRLIRDNVVIHEGKLSTLKRFKDDAAEVRSGQECGMSFESYQDMRAGDVIECYRVEEVKRTL
ncbi:bacterial translation initiation factor 2 (bIF-2) [Rhizobiales bacterium GAS188]|nr:bacterial translation initiation factor 2 (bIF-2) [Rhizobiales bacterium GAS188]